ncbi:MULTISPECIES: hypothetical protein [Streptomyces]|uniref:hypothetical protein n=1 Tax=Streptomyces TaxID=1883 RepID=UPI00345DBE6B
MVTCHDLYACRVDQWQKAADDWVDLARRSSSACEDIRAQGKKPLDDHWADATGKTAGKRLEDLADRLESGGDIMKGVAMVLDALAHSMGYAQRTLSHAVELANENGLSMQDGRAVGVYTGAVPTGPNVPQNVRDAYAKEPGHISTVNALIDEALREASQADTKASAELDKLARTINVSDTSQAHNEILGRTHGPVTSSSTSRSRPERRPPRAGPTMPPSSPRSPLTGTSSSPSTRVPSRT